MIVEVNGAEKARKLREEIENTGVMTGGVLCLDRHFDWRPYVREFVPSAKFVVYPNVGGYVAVTTTPFRFPEAIDIDYETREKFGIIWIHPAGVLIRTETLIGAVDYCKSLILESENYKGN